MDACVRGEITTAAGPRRMRATRAPSRRPLMASVPPRGSNDTTRRTNAPPPVFTRSQVSAPSLHLRQAQLSQPIGTLELLSDARRGCVVVAGPPTTASAAERMSETWPDFPVGRREAARAGVGMQSRPYSVAGARLLAAPQPVIVQSTSERDADGDFCFATVKLARQSSRLRLLAGEIVIRASLPVRARSR